MSAKVILPGATIGILGSGQLGRMTALAARAMGYRVHVYSPDQDTPAGAVADREWHAPYEDAESLVEFAHTVDVVTMEFENIPRAAADRIEKFRPVRPGPEVLHITQHRLREKTFLQKRGFPTTAWRAVGNPKELLEALSALGPAAVLKTAGFGYDGKGQRKVHSPETAAAAYGELGGGEMALESLVDFACEIAVIGARNPAGATACFVPTENAHAHHILDLAMVPAVTPPAAILSQAAEMTQELLKALDVTGLLCVEMFVTKSGKLLVNELAPRPHNSGHLTLEAAATSQFEQNLRAVCGLPLGAPDVVSPAAMANLLGELWAKGEPRWQRALAFPWVKLHLYGKTQPRPGRKMGHLTALAPTPQEAARQARDARHSLEG
jgi:5-(carboxyamino)imidazole ribonucleotide synthase